MTDRQMASPEGQRPDERIQTLFTAACTLYTSPWQRIYLSEGFMPESQDTESEVRLTGWLCLPNVLSW